MQRVLSANANIKCANLKGWNLESNKGTKRMMQQLSIRSGLLSIIVRVALRQHVRSATIIAYFQTDWGSIPAEDKSFSRVEKELTELEVVGAASRCSWMRTLRAFTSGRRRYEKCPLWGFEKESVFLARWGGSGGTSGSGSGSEGVGVDGGAGDPPSGKRSSPCPFPLTMSAHERTPRR